MADIVAAPASGHKASDLPGTNETNPLSVVSDRAAGAAPPTHSAQRQEQVQYTIDEAIEAAGFGRFQVGVLLMCGL
eukprot:SAG31_NODE_15774_length_739_cov_1.210938_1_plen_75_part_01